MRRLAIAGLVAVLAGCQHVPWYSEEYDVVVDGERRPAPRTVSLIDNARSVREDITYPDGTKQAFKWQGQYAEWRFAFPRKGYAYAGFRFWVPLNLSRAVDKYELSFSIQPKSKAKQLWLALVDGDEDGQATLVELPIKPFMCMKLTPRGCRIKIPISDFPVTGIPVQGEEGDVSIREYPFDWKDVRQIRIVNHGGRMPAGDIVVTDLKFRR